MNYRYQINRVFLVLFTLFISTLIFLIIIDDVAFQSKIAYLVFCSLFFYTTILAFFMQTILDNDSIKNKIYFFPFYTKVRKCRFEEIRKIIYNFVVFEEIGSFTICPWDDDVNKTVVINFLTNNKKEIIQKILEKRPDLKLEDWVWERVLNYKIVRKKFLIVSSVIILICILISIAQYIQR